MKLRPCIWHLIERANRGSSRVIVVKVPGGEHAVLANSSVHLDHSGGAEIGPGHFLRARPDHPHRFARRFSQTSGFRGGLFAVLASVAGTGIGNDDADLLFGKTEGSGKVGADSEGALS